MRKSNQFDYKGWSCNLGRVGHGYYGSGNMIDGIQHFFTETKHGVNAKRDAKAAVISEVNTREAQEEKDRDN